MAEERYSLKTAQVALARVRGFSMLWLKLVCLGGFVVLVGGPWILGILESLFGPDAANPARVITLNMIVTLPVAIFLWIQQQRLAEGETACGKCGERYSKTNASCPMCGTANPSRENTTS